LYGQSGKAAGVSCRTTSSSTTPDTAPLMMAPVKLDSHVPLTESPATSRLSKRMPLPPVELVNVPVHVPASDVPKSRPQPLNASTATVSTISVIIGRRFESLIGSLLH